MSLLMPTREFVGLLTDVLPFASPDDEDTAWHRIVLTWDGARLHASAGNGLRMAWMSWGVDDGDQPTIPAFAYTPEGDSQWELAILPSDAKELATKFKVSPKEGETPLLVDGSADGITVRRHSDTGMVALTGAALSRPWDDNAPNIPDQIGKVADRASNGQPVKVAAFSGMLLADFANPKVVRQRGDVILSFGPASAYVQIGRHFRGALINAERPNG